MPLCLSAFPRASRTVASTARGCSNISPSPSHHSVRLPVSIGHILRPPPLKAKSTAQDPDESRRAGSDQISLPRPEPKPRGSHPAVSPNTGAKHCYPTFALSQTGFLRRCVNYSSNASGKASADHLQSSHPEPDRINRPCAPSRFSVAAQLVLAASQCSLVASCPCRPFANPRRFRSWPHGCGRSSVAVAPSRPGLRLGAAFASCHCLKRQAAVPFP